MAKNKIITMVFITAMSSQIDFSKASSAKKRKLKDNLTLKKACLLQRMPPTEYTV